MVDESAYVFNPPVFNVAVEPTPAPEREGYNMYGELSPDFSATYAAPVYRDFNGDKFAGGFGHTFSYTPDYWTLRERSSQLFKDNLYARGLIRRLVTNEINIGIFPESSPFEEVLGVPEGSLGDWTDYVEDRYQLWCSDPRSCDRTGAMDMGALQRAARREALITGDVLVFLYQNPKTGLPSVQLLSGTKVRSPLHYDLPEGYEIKHGVEMDAIGRHVAYWVTQKDGSTKRLPAFGGRRGRRMAWLVYGTDKRLDDVRGEPLLSIILQSLKELDRYRDSAQRKAVINSILAMFIKKNEDRAGTLPMTNGAARRTKAVADDKSNPTRSLNITEHIPGLVLDELQVGEEPVFNGGEGTDINLGAFEEVIIQSIAWANEVPPEILRLAFSNNYSASQAAINEFKLYLNKFWSEFSCSFCSPIYQEWFISEVLNRKIEAPGFLEAWRDITKRDVYNAWVYADWYGTVKISTDPVKQIKGAEMAIANGLSTRAKESRAINGTKYSKNVKRLAREAEQLVDTLRPVEEFRAALKAPVVAEPKNAEDGANASALGELDAMLTDYLSTQGT